jgi:hypothetical protein
MTSEETGQSHATPGEAERDFAALADQWADKNWYLPPGGDQSWRDREARRLFGGDGETPDHDYEDRASSKQIDPATDETVAPLEPGFRRGKMLGVVLPLLLAACAVLFVPIFMPRLLTSDFWAPYEPKAPSAAPVQPMSRAAAAGDANLRPSQDGASDRGVAANDAVPQQAGRAVAPIKIYRDTVMPNARSAMVMEGDRKDGRSAAPTIAKGQSTPSPAIKTRATRHLPPIGAAYFASHAPAGARQMADSTRPIGQAYFESHSSARSD